MIARILQLLPVLVTVFGLCAASPARAANVTATYCVTYASLAYNDGATGNRFTGSSWAAWGVWLRFTNKNGVITDHILGTNGCKSVTIDATYAPYTVTVLRKASVTGSLVRVLNASGILLSDIAYTNFTPSGATYNINTTGDAAHVLAAGTFALASDDAGQDVTFDFVLDACPTAPSGSCDRVLVDGRIYIHDLHRREKFLIVHEVGHAISDAADGDLESANDPNAALEGCNASGGPDSYTVSAYKQNSKEFQSEAAVEGIADYYAALAFNTSGTNAACTFNELSRPDWSANGTVTNDEPEVFSCEAGIVLTGDDVPPSDYLGWKCIAIGQVNNRATEYDWLRHLWDLDTDYGQTPTTIFAIWDAADPHNWTTTGAGTGGAYPAQRMHDAAFTVGGAGLQVSYDACAGVNGTSR